MCHRVYAPEFKAEAVRQILEPGETVQEVAAGGFQSMPIQLAQGGSAKRDGKTGGALLEAKRANLTLEAELRRTQEEWDISKRGRRAPCQKARVEYA